MKSLIKRMFVAGGGAAAIRSATKSRLRVLMYHRFPGGEGQVREAISKQCGHLRAHYQPVSLAAAAAGLAGDAKLPASAVAVTVDDGYADFRAAWPIFRDFQIPVTLFVVSGFVDRRVWLWPDVVEYCLRETRETRLRIELRANLWVEQSLNSADERAVADEALDAALIALPNEDRLRAVAALPELLGVNLPAEVPEKFQPLTWDELRAMSAEGLDVGAHTVTHPVVSRLESPEAVRREIGGSKAAIEQALGVPVRNFCYPNGMAADYNADCVAAVREAGFASAVTAIRGLNARGASAFELRRIGVEPSMPMEAFALETAGYRMV